MALPQQLKSARMTDATPASSIDNEVGNLEKALADILGIPIDTDIVAPIVSGYGGTKYATISNSSTVANTNLTTAFNKSYIIPANTLKAGDLIRIYSQYMVNLVSGTINLMTTLGGTAFFAYQQVAGLQANTPWWSHVAYLLVRSIGASGSVVPGLLVGYVAATQPNGVAGLGGVAGVFALDTTAPITIGWAAGPSISDPNNKATLLAGTVEILSAESTS